MNSRFLLPGKKQWAEETAPKHQQALSSHARRRSRTAPMHSRLLRVGRLQECSTELPRATTSKLNLNFEVVRLAGFVFDRTRRSEHVVGPTHGWFEGAWQTAWGALGYLRCGPTWASVDPRPPSRIHANTVPRHLAHRPAATATSWRLLHGNRSTPATGFIGNPRLAQNETTRTAETRPSFPHARHHIPLVTPATPQNGFAGTAGLWPT